MASMQHPLKAEMEDGKTFEVVADQRDLAAYEAYSEGKTYVHGGTRYICWNALRRQKKTTLSWDKFNDTCIEVTAVGDATKS